MCFCENLLPFLHLIISIIAIQFNDSIKTFNYDILELLCLFRTTKTRFRILREHSKTTVFLRII